MAPEKLQTATAGLTGDLGQRFYERTVKVDLLQIVRLEPLAALRKPPENGGGAT